MTTGADIVAEARTWLGTPWQHQASLKGVATDCLGLIAGVGLAFNLDGADRWRADRRMVGYTTSPDARLMLQVCADYLDPADGKSLGDILLLRFDAEPQHFAFVSCLDPPRIIHAYAQIGRVVENGIDEHWRERIVRAYRFRGLT